MNDNNLIGNDWVDDRTPMQVMIYGDFKKGDIRVQPISTSSSEEDDTQNVLFQIFDKRDVMGNCFYVDNIYRIENELKALGYDCKILEFYTNIYLSDDVIKREYKNRFSKND